MRLKYEPSSEPNASWAQIAAFLASYSPAVRDVATFSLLTTGPMRRKKKGGVHKVVPTGTKAQREVRTPETRNPKLETEAQHARTTKAKPNTPQTQKQNPTRPKPKSETRYARNPKPPESRNPKPEPNTPETQNSKPKPETFFFKPISLNLPPLNPNSETPTPNPTPPTPHTPTKIKSQTPNPETRNPSRRTS